MRRVSYAGLTFVTTDEMAEALVTFAAAIARSGLSQQVLVPAVDDEGTAEVIDMVIGPSSEMITIPEHGSSTLDTAAAVQDLQARTAAFDADNGPHYASPMDEQSEDPLPDY